jgi:4-hydroxybutyrate CoA-transferase
VSDTARIFGRRWVEPAEAVSGIGPGSRIGCGLIEPTDLLLALAQRGLPGEATIAVIGFGGLALGESGTFTLRTAFATPASRPLAKAGKCEYLPLLFSRARAFFATEALDFVLVRLAPPNADGLCSYGWAAGFTPELIEVARARGVPIIAEIDDAMPRTHSGYEIPAETIERACPAVSPAAVDTPVPPSAHAPAIATHLREIIPDGATLQIGIGSVPDASVALLDGRSDLGIHTEVLGPGLVSLVRKGRANGKRKGANVALAVSTIASVDPAVHEFVHDNPGAPVRSSSDVLDPRRIAEHDCLRCVNSAIAVDLRGQVDAETIAGEQVAGVGGQLDFFRGAGLRDDALRIVAVESTAARGRVSRIVPSLGERAVVTSTRYDVDYVVTEHGVARMIGRTDEQRARALVDVAHPEFRDQLRAALP